MTAYISRGWGLWHIFIFRTLLHWKNVWSEKGGRITQDDSEQMIVGRDVCEGLHMKCQSTSLLLRYCEWKMSVIYLVCFPIWLWTWNDKQWLFVIWDWGVGETDRSSISVLQLGGREREGEVWRIEMRVKRKDWESLMRMVTAGGALHALNPPLSQPLLKINLYAVSNTYWSAYH